MICASGLKANASEAGEVKLTWNNTPQDHGFNLYRSTQDFSQPTGAVKINHSLLKINQFTDLPADGTYYYRIQAVNAASTTSELSAPVRVKADSSLPYAVAIEYQPEGHFDPQTQRYGVGRVMVKLSVNEALLTTPFLTLTPDGGMPITVILRRQSETEYSGDFMIDEHTVSGTAYAVFSARDLLGNRGTEIKSGDRISIDTQGPQVIKLTTTPPSPIQNDINQAVSVNVDIELDEAVTAEPTLSYYWNNQNNAVNITPLQQNGPHHWSATFNLDATIGQNNPQQLNFIWSAKDDLTNQTDQQMIEKNIQVYQGDLPALTAPDHFNAEATAGGGIQLTWNGVIGAVDYEIYRQAPGETELTKYRSSEAKTSFSEITTPDGEYQFAVASVRHENDQFSLSEWTEAITINVDSHPPEAPQNLVLALKPYGIQAQWTAPADETHLSYHLYRSSEDDITSLAGLTPILTATETSAKDPTPSEQAHAYVVTALDGAHNESPPSQSVYLNFDLLPVSTLKVIQTDDEAPELTWSHPSQSVTGYQLNLYSAAHKTPLDLISEPQYADLSYRADEREYGVIAIDDHQKNSLERKIKLPALTPRLLENQELNRGQFNLLAVMVRNEGQQAVTDYQLDIEVDGHHHRSPLFDLEAQQEQVIPVVVGGYSSLKDRQQLTFNLTQTTADGEHTQLIRHEEIAVNDHALLSEIETENFTRGGQGKARFKLTNSSEIPLWLVTAQSQGKKASPDIRFKLLDGGQNVLSIVPMQQFLGSHFRNLSDGRTVTEILPQQTLTSDWFTINTALTAPLNAILQLEIDHIYSSTRTDAVVLNGPTTRHAITMIETPYFGSVDQIEPQFSDGSQPITISGKAINRMNHQALAHKDLKLFIKNEGYEREITVTTDETGQYQTIYQVAAHESGPFSVACIHPDMTARPIQNKFVIGRVNIDPVNIKARLPRNYQAQLKIKIKVTPGAEQHQVKLQYLAIDQTQAELLTGIKVELPETVPLIDEYHEAEMHLTLSADNTAAEQGQLFFRISSDENPELKTITVNYEINDMKPILAYQPAMIETGVAHGNTISEIVTIENTGFLDFSQLKMTLLTEQDQPVPTWIDLMTTNNIDKINIGEKKDIQLGIKVDETVSQGTHSFKLQVTTKDQSVATIPIFVHVSESGKGDILFHVKDMYTATLDENGQAIQGVSGARIKLMHEDLIQIEIAATTDDYGEVLLKELTTGLYQYRVSKSNHKDVSGRVYIKAGMTIAQPVFMDMPLVTVEWSVKEITLLDVYEIVLDATYKTNVPAAVVVAEPASITLPEMQPGDVFYAEYSVTNYGLIRADNVHLIQPPTNEAYRFEFLAAVPETLEAKQRITVPYRVTALNAVTKDGSSSGGGCGVPVYCASIPYNFTCAGGDSSGGSASHCAAPSGSGGGCSGGGSGGGGLIFASGGSGGGSGGTITSGGQARGGGCPGPPPPGPGGGGASGGGGCDGGGSSGGGSGGGC